MITYSGKLDKNIIINFLGSNNRLTVHDNASIDRLTLQFDCSNATIEIGGHGSVNPLKAYIRIGQDATVRLGYNVSTTNTLTITAAEGTSVTIGDDVMIATDVEIRADDGHPIFDVLSGKRVNPSQSIQIGNHVWLAKGSTVLAGAKIGDGSVLGHGSLLAGKIPNNCVAVGSPARVVRRNTVWERPHLSGHAPYYKPDASTVRKSAYWNMTEDSEVPLTSRNHLLMNLRRRAWRIRRRLLNRT
ncbi:acyltransferase [Specibacter sp. RAF43]|uniref:acyltransferase n=1 Tax=Specibacter sp. RAF43 TaxID=3233057 RepID=UPI003F9A1BF9